MPRRSYSNTVSTRLANVFQRGWRLVGREIPGLLENPLADSGFGLVGLRERIVGLGGRVSVDSAAGRGVTLTVEVPG